MSVKSGLHIERASVYRLQHRELITGGWIQYISLTLYTYLIN